MRVFKHLLSSHPVSFLQTEPVCKHYDQSMEYWCQQFTGTLTEAVCCLNERELGYTGFWQLTVNIRRVVSEVLLRYTHYKALSIAESTNINVTQGTLSSTLVIILRTSYCNIYRIWILSTLFIMWHVDPLPSNSCVNRRHYNSRCQGSALWTRRFPGKGITRNNMRDVFCEVHAEAI
jgi:hypothetical protein